MRPPSRLLRHLNIENLGRKAQVPRAPKIRMLENVWMLETCSTTGSFFTASSKQMLNLQFYYLHFGLLILLLFHFFSNLLIKHVT